MKATTLRANVSRAGRRTLGLGLGVTMLAGCSFGGLNSLDMPGTSGHGRGSYTVTAELPDIATLPQNSPVMLDDVTVGSVSGVEALQRPDGTFYAAVKLSLDQNVKLPTNATARVAQTSLLGSQHVELGQPEGKPSDSQLRNGSVIPLSQATERYPTTEEVLSALGIVVNKGNLAGLQDITDEAYNAVANREGQFADLIPRLAQFTASLDAQTNDIIAAAEGLNRFAGTLARNRDSLGRALDSLPEALRVLNDNRTNIVDTFAALKRFSEVASRILATKDDLAADLKDLYAVIKPLNDNRADLVTDLDLLPTFPFTTKYLRRAVRGDYLNVFVTFDLTVRRLGETIFTTSPLDPNMKHLQEIINPPDWLVGSMANLSGQAADPFKIPPGTASGQEVPPN